MSNRVKRRRADAVDTRASAEGHDIADELRDLMTLLRIRTGHDFSSYKQGTLLRRIARRYRADR